jgi:phosphopantothenoylcysteine decarboxylase/phosphopantothenate--cysteine ligase
LAQNADLIIVAPATADFMARMVHGRANDLLAATVLATSSTVLVAPAMNDNMWSKAATQRNVTQLRADGYHVVDPDVGPLAAGEGEGPGRMVEPEYLVALAARLLAPVSPLRGVSVVVTAGATREAIDPVRFISNHSSGKMGVALAAAAWGRGANVTLVAGPITVAPPRGVAVVNVMSTEDMAAAVRQHLPSTKVLIMAAAPADFKPEVVASEKLSKRAGLPSISLRRTTDILRSTSAVRPLGSLIVGFALETGDALRRARGKLQEKDLDMIVVNDATEPGAGFAVDTNRVVLLFRDGREIELPLLHKDEVSQRILDNVEDLLNGGK